MINLEKVYYHYIFSDDGINYINNVKDIYFDNQDIRVSFNVSKEYYFKYKSFLSRDQLKDLIKIKSLNDKITDEKIDYLYDFDITEYDLNWIKSNIESWIKFKNLNNSIYDLIEYIKTTKVTTDNINDVIDNVKSIINRNNNLDFTFNKGSSVFDVSSHYILKNETITTGYDFLDNATNGGYYKKSLFVFIAPPKVGKSLWLTNLAANCIINGVNSIYITLEMSENLIARRIGSNLFNININEYDNYLNEIPKKIEDFKNSSLIPPGNLIIKEFPTSDATVNDIEHYIKKSEELNNIKYDIVFVDYLNIIKTKTVSNENIYLKNKVISEELRSMAIRNNWCVVTANQVNRSGYDNSDLGLSNISESSGVIHTVDLMIGIIQDSLLYANNKYILKILANRNGGFKNAKKKFNVDYNYMRITNDNTSDITYDDF